MAILVSKKVIACSIICFVLVLRGLFLAGITINKHPAGAWGHMKSSAFMLPTTVNSGTYLASGTASSSIRAAGSKDPRPRGLRLAIIGDSVSRYNYLYLAYFLHYGEWYQSADATLRNLVNEKTFRSWDEFFNQSNALLRPHELCDCYRRDATTKANLKVAHENRYFHDGKEERDNLLVYIQAFGHQFVTHGTKQTSNILNQIHNGTRAEYRILGSSKSSPRPMPNFTWSYRDWSDVVLHHLRNLSISHVVINGGLWGTRWSQATEQQRFLEALQATNMTGIWRTTTYNSEQILIEPETNEAMVRLFSSKQGRAPGDVRAAASTNVLDASWTKDLNKSLYWDGVHFGEGPYQVLCEDLLQQVLHHEFPIDYVQFDRTTLFK